MLSRHRIYRALRIGLLRNRGALVAAAIALVVAGISIPAGRFVMGGDSTWPELNPYVAMAQHASGWAGYAGFGEDDAFIQPILPIAAFDAVLESVGVSPLGVNHLWMALLVLLQATATVRLFNELFPRARRHPVAVVFAGSAAILNPLLLLIFHTPYPALDIGIAAAPGMLAAMLAFLRGARGRSLIEFAFWACLTVPSNMNPAFVMEYVALMGCAAGLAFATNLAGRAKLGIRLVEIALLYVGANAAFWVPIAHYAGSAYGSLSASGQAYTADTLLSTSAFSRIENVVRLVGGYLFFNPVGKRLYVPEGPSYVANAFVVVATLGLPLLAWSALWLYRRGRTRIVVFGVGGVAFAALFLAKGVSPPLGGVFAWLFTHVGLFAAFRDSFDKFAWIVLLCYAVLAGATLAAIERTMPRRYAIAIAAGAFALLLGSAYPILSGHLFWAKASVAPPARYAALGAWEQRQPSGDRFAQLPVASVLFEAYDWGYVGAGFGANLTDRAIVSREYDFVQPATLELEDALQHVDGEVGVRHLASFVGTFGVTHIVTDTSMNPNYYAPGSDAAPAAIANARRVAAFGSISVFALDPSVSNPRIYAPQRVITGARTAQQVAAICGVIACRGAAFVDERSAALPAPAVERVAFTRDVSGSSTGATVFERGSRGLAPTEAASGLSAHRTPFARSSATQLFCSPVRGVASRAFALQPAPGSTVFALRVRYRASGDAWLSVSDARSAGNFSVELLPAKDATLVRLLRMPKAAPLELVAIASGVGSASCIQIEGASIAAAAQPTSLRLVGSAADLYVTLPYVARNPALAAAGAYEEYRKRAHGARGFGLPSRGATAFWSPPVALTGSPSGVQARHVPAGASGVALRTSNAQAYVYAIVDRVLPGGAYDVRIPLASWSGIAPRVAVLAQSGEILAQRVVNASDLRAGALSLSVENPGSSGRLAIYLYAGSQLAGTSSITIGDPSVRAARADDVMLVYPGRTIATPALVRSRELDAATYDVRVTDAPQRYVLVLNDSFSTGWRATVPAGVLARHVVANLAMNGWVMSGRGSYDVILHYDGKRYRTIGLLVAALCLALLAGLQVTGVAR
jgi:hypothetical protein